MVMCNFTQWIEALGFANFRAANTGIRQRVCSVVIEPFRIWQVQPIDGASSTKDQSWAEKLAISLQARSDAKKIRDGKPVSFRHGPRSGPYGDQGRRSQPRGE